MATARSQHSDVVLRLIGAFKLVKAATLIALGIGALSLIRNEHLRGWITALAKDVENRHLLAALSAISTVDERHLRELGAASFIYAGLFTIEGLGLLLRRVWAEYVTIVITVSFVPLEIYELVERVSVIKAIVLVANLAIVVYLGARLRRDHRWPFH